MSSLWIVILIIGWFVWALLAVADVYDNADGDFSLKNILSAISVSEIFAAWVSVTVFVIFFASLFTFIIGRMQ